MKLQKTHDELEIALHRLESVHYHVELRFHDGSSEAQLPPQRGPAHIDDSELMGLQLEPEAYGRCLSEGIFHHPSVRRFYERVRTSTESKGHYLRIRLLVGDSAPELRALRWELLQDPVSGDPLATSERVLFSRFLLSRDWRPVQLRAKSALRGLVAVAAPSGLKSYGLTEVDAVGEVERAAGILGQVRLTVLGESQPLTLECLVEGMRGGIDILYLVCHGALNRRGVPYLFLQNPDGAVERIEAESFARCVRELRDPPRLVVLASCESAGTEAGISAQGAPTFQASLAPRLAEAGVPAIVAMQGKVSMETVQGAMPIFFRELLDDGQIDRAMAVARGAVRRRSDHWMPALFLRLRRGRIWYVPGFTHEDGAFSKWRSLVGSVRQGRCVPILGADVGEHVFGSSREIADRLGRRHAFPFASRDRSRLPKVTQYLSVRESRQYARDAVVSVLRTQVMERFPELAESSLSLPRSLDRITEMGGEEDPLRLLAGLGCSVYVHAGVDPMLLKTLKVVGRRPRPLLCDWRVTRDSHPREPLHTGEPTVEEPIVYHPFGVLGRGDSLVLTEDDYFDHLIATAEYKLMPTAVRGALTRSSLLFLGFQLDDLAFRSLFRLIMTLGGVHKLRELAHVGVQVDPADHDVNDLEGARAYLEDYFGSPGEAPPISIYWGTPTDFLKELHRQMATLDLDEVPGGRLEDDDDWLS